MGRPKKKRKPTRRRKSVNEGVPVDRSEPGTWGPNLNARTTGRSTIDMMAENGGLSDRQKEAADRIYRAFCNSLPGCLTPRAVDLNRVSGEPPLDSAVSREIDERNLYLRWIGEVHPEVKKITLGVVVDGRTLDSWSAPARGSFDKPIGKKAVRAKLKAGLDAFVFACSRKQLDVTAP